MAKNLREASRGGWVSNSHNGPTIEELNLGCMLRIADSIELMAKNHGQLVDERDRYKNLYYTKIGETNKMARSIAGLRGYINRKKKKQNGQKTISTSSK